MSDYDWMKPDDITDSSTAPVAFVYYFCDGGNFEVRTFTADELPADESEWDWFIENELQGYYGRSEGIRYIWGYNEVPELPEKPVIATGPKPIPTWMDCQPPELAVPANGTPEKKRDFSPTYYEEPSHRPPVNEDKE